MQVLNHHIYEYQKGLRHLVLHTMNSKDLERAERKLQKYEIDYLTVRVNSTKVNIFFGSQECVDVVRSFNGKPLNLLTAEQDFILGIMLGYDRKAQCERFLKRKPCENVLKVKNGKVKLMHNTNFYLDLGIV